MYFLIVAIMVIRNIMVRILVAEAYGNIFHIRCAILDGKQGRLFDPVQRRDLSFEEIADVLIVVLGQCT
jgi:hypothetical protein